MLETKRYTPEEIIAEAQRVARERFKNGSFDIGEGHLCEMIGELRGEKDTTLFLSTFSSELIRISNENKAQKENNYLQGNV